MADPTLLTQAAALLKVRNEPHRQLTVRLPRSVTDKLEAEAGRLGVSLNELVGAIVEVAMREQTGG